MIALLFGILVVIGVVSVLVEIGASPFTFILVIGAVYVISKYL